MGVKLLSPAAMPAPHHFNKRIVMPTADNNNQLGLFSEEEILNENRHLQYKLQDLALNASIGFYFDNTAERTSAEFGDFTVAQGLLVDLGAASIDAFVADVKPISFVLNTMLMNKVIDGALVPGEAYRISKIWDKNQKFADRTVAKGYGYGLFHQNIPPAVKAQLKEAYKAVLNPLNLPSETPLNPDTTQDPFANPAPTLPGVR